ncbi:MAG: GlcG/HbpS family heme-binding protein [Phyllobacterium sp.]
MMSANSSTMTDELLSEAICEAAVNKAIDKAHLLGVAVSIAVLDAGGHLLRLVRMDGIHAGTVEISQAKARCAVMFKRPTKAFAQSYAAGTTSLIALPGVVPFEGGVPIMMEGCLLGAIGCSGASPEQDGEIAMTGLIAIQAVWEKPHD